MHVSDQEGARRETQRSIGTDYSVENEGRLGGWSRTSAAITHEKMIYDFEIDNSNLSIEETAKEIIAAYRATPHPKAFKELEKIFL